MPEDAPDLVLLVADDLRWDAVGYSGNPIAHTPAIDALARTGTVFENAFCSCSLCAASRTTIYTGMYPAGHGVHGFLRPIPLPLQHATFPAVLRRAGYTTAFVGKWGIGPWLPRSFDYIRAFPGQGHYRVPGEPRHLTALTGDWATELLETAPRDAPLALTVCFKAPHVQDGASIEYDYDPAWGGLYENQSIPLAPTATEEHFRALPLFLRNSENRDRWSRRFRTPALAQQSLKGYHRLVAGLDSAVGRILDAAQRNDRGRETVVLFTSDNGVLNGEHGLAGKWLMRNESIRVPLILSDPRARSVRARAPEMVLNTDIAPSLLELAGIRPPVTMQGRSLVPLLTQGPADWRTEWFYENRYRHTGRIRPCEGIRTLEWVYTRYPRTTPVFEELFSLMDDPGETQNLADDRGHGGQLANLRELCSLWKNALTRTVWDGCAGPTAPSVAPVGA